MRANCPNLTETMKRLVGMYLCHACGRYIEREADEGKPLKKWRKSYCEKTGKNARIWLKLQHNMPHRHNHHKQNTMKRTKKELAERKARAAEIAALYATVANGGRMQRNYGNKANPSWAESDGPTIYNDLSMFRAIPVPKKPEPKKPEPRTWWLHMKNGRVVSVMPFDPVGAEGAEGEYVKVREVEP